MLPTLKLECRCGYRGILVTDEDYTRGLLEHRQHGGFNLYQPSDWNPKEVLAELNNDMDFAVQLKKTSLVPTDVPESRSTSPFSRVVDPLIPSKEPDEEEGPSFSHMFKE